MTTEQLQVEIDRLKTLLRVYVRHVGYNEGVDFLSDFHIEGSPHRAALEEVRILAGEGESDEC